MFLGMIVQVLSCSYVFTVSYLLLLFFSHLSFCNCKGSTASCSEEASRFGRRNVKPINKLIGSTRGVFRGGPLGHGPPLWVARIAKLHSKVSKIEASPPPFVSWASGFQAFGWKFE